MKLEKLMRKKKEERGRNIIILDKKQRFALIIEKKDKVVIRTYIIYVQLMSRSVRENTLIYQNYLNLHKLIKYYKIVKGTQSQQRKAFKMWILISTFKSIQLYISIKYQH